MNKEQKKALAIAQARLRAKQKKEQAQAQAQAQYSTRNIAEDLALLASNPLLAMQRGTRMRGMDEAEQQQQREVERQLKRELAEGALLGGLGEIQAVGSGIKGAISGEGFVPSFKESLAKSEAEASKFRQEYPVSSTAAQIAGSIPMGAAGAARIAGTTIGQQFPRIAQTIGAGLSGSAAGALSTEGGIKERATGGGIGALIGGGLGAAGQFLPRVTEKAKGLLAEDIPLTIGQSFGGLVKSAEELATSVPIVREIIKGAERKSALGFNKLAVEDALSSIGFKAPQTATGTDLIKAADDAINEAYKRAIPKSGLPNAQPMFAEFERIMGKNIDLKSENFKQLRAKFKVALDPSLFKDDLSMSGEQAHKTMKFLGQQANKFMKTGDPDNQQMAKAMFEAQTFFRNELARQNPNSKELLEVTKAFRQFQPVLKASTAAPSKGGEFTPAQLLAKQKAVNEKRFARGEMPSQQLAQTAQDVMAREIPDSGTPIRALTGLLASNPAAIPPAMLAATGAGLLYGTRAGTSLGRGLIAAPAQTAGALALAPMVSGQTASLLAQ